MKISVVIAEYKRSWLIATLGIVLYGFGIAILNINEGRSYHHKRALEDALSEAISFKNDDFQQTSGKSENYEGKLIHVVGTLYVHEPISDATYNILVQSVKLKKIVQMYQWHEDYTESKFAESGDESARSYFYFKDWNEQVIDSRSFHSFGYQNPRQLPMQSKVLTADKAFIGVFELGEAVKDIFEGWTDVTSDTRPEDNYIKMHLGWYFHVDDLFEPQVGDTRVKFQFCGLEGTSYTVVGKLINGKIQPYKSRLKKDVLLLAKGELSIDQIFSEEHHTLRKKTWVIRFFGFSLIFFGVLSTENLLKFFANSKLSFLSPGHSHQLKNNLRVAATITIGVCLLRQAIHFIL